MTTLDVDPPGRRNDQHDSRPGTAATTEPPPATNPAVTTTRQPPSSRPGCPAQHGQATDLRRAVFTFAAENSDTGPDGQPQITEIWGFFREPGQDHEDDILETGYLALPAGSPIAIQARRIALLPGLSRTVEGTLRANITACPCTRQPVPHEPGALPDPNPDPGAECPALNALRLLEAIGHTMR